MRTSLVILATIGLALTGAPAVAKPAAPPVVSVFDTTAGETVLAPNAKLEIRLDRKATKPVTVTWTTAEGTAKAGSDYNAASGKVVLAPGQRVKKIEVQVLDDDTSEQTEYFYVDYTVRGAKAARKRATVSLIDDDLYAYGGQLEITERWEQEANGFHTIETWTLVFRPQVTSFNQGTAWYDNGYGQWELTGSRVLEDRRPGADCRTVEKEAYDGRGTFFTEPHPDTDVAGTEGNLVLQGFFPQHPGNLGQKPSLHTVVSAHTDGTSYTFDGQDCVPSEYENEERFALEEAPGRVRSTGVLFDHHVLEDNSTDERGLDTYQLDVIGELRALTS